METAVLTSVKVSTATLQDLVSRAVKGSTMVDVIPLSCLMQVKIENKTLIVKTTDNINFLTLTAPDVDAPDFEMVVQSKLFSQLVSKLSTKDTTFEIQGNQVVIKANGTYNIPLSTDSDGSKINFPSPEFTPNGTSYQLTNDEVRSILTLNKSCKAEMKEMPSIYNYYMDDTCVLTTNMFKGCKSNIKAFSTPVCLPPTLVDLIPVVSDESGVTVSQNETSVQFTSSKGTLVGKKCLPADLENFPAEGLLGVFNEQINNKASLNKTQMINAMDRICLFVDVLESNKLTVTFGNESVKLFSASTNSTEVVKYTGAITLDEEVSFDIDAQFLKTQLAACSEEALELRFSDATGIQITSGVSTLALSVLSEDDM